MRVRLGRDVATLLVAIAIGSVLAVMAYVRHTHPRRDTGVPCELSRLGPPFNPQGNGVRKC